MGRAYVVALVDPLCGCIVTANLLILNKILKVSKCVLCFLKDANLNTTHVISVVSSEAVLAPADVSVLETFSTNSTRKDTKDLLSKSPLIC